MKRVESKEELQVGKMYLKDGCQYLVYVRERNENIQAFYDYDVYDEYKSKGKGEPPEVYLTNKEIKKLEYI